MNLPSSCPRCKRVVHFAAPNADGLSVCPRCSHAFRNDFTTTGAPVAIPDPSSTPAVPGHDALPVPADSTARPIRFSFPCQNCGTILEADDTQCCQPGRCPTCNATLLIPEVDRRTGLAHGPPGIHRPTELPTPLHAFAAAGAAAPRIERRADDSQIVVCPRCRAENAVDADICEACRLPFTMEGTERVAASMRAAKSLALTAFIVGVGSLPTSCLPIAGPVAMGIGAVALRRMERAGPMRAARAAALAGIVLGGVSIVLWWMLFAR